MSGGRDRHDGGDGELGSIHLPGTVSWPATADTPGTEAAQRKQPMLPVTMRPPLMPMLVFGAVVLVQPSRRGSLLLAGSAAGPTSRLAFLSYAIGAAGLLLTGLVARTHVTLGRGADGHLILFHQGFVHRRAIPLGAVHEIRLVSGPAARAIFLGGNGTAVATVSAFTKFWRQDDVCVALRAASVEISHEHRLNRAVDVEAAYPGTTAWVERHPWGVAALVGLAAIGTVFFVAWLLEF